MHCPTRFRTSELFGIRATGGSSSSEAALLLGGLLPRMSRLLDSSEWDRIPAGAVELVTSHEVLYLEPDLRDFMSRMRRVLASNGVAYIVLGCHAENPLWEIWKASLMEAGHRVYDHRPLDIMEAASSSGFLPSVQPLRPSGWITYDPLRAEFRYPDVQTMFDHHYRHKLIFRLRVANDRTPSS